MWRCIKIVFCSAAMLLGIQNFVYAEKSDEKAKAKPVEVHIVVDVSGSMKRTDPRNQRIPATRLLIHLLPKDTAYAGIWLFGNGTREIMPAAKITKEWLKEADVAVRQIHSNSPWTNIDAGLQAAAASWEFSADKSEHIILLLSDGQVDLPSGEAENQLERKRILKESIPELKRQNITVYAVALSDESDEQLLRAIAARTGGFSQKINRAEELSRTFLKVFENAMPVDAIPINGNQFKVDPGIKEVTLMLFKGYRSKPPELIDPHSQHLTFEKHPDAITWVREEDFDMITLHAPDVGNWQIDSDMDIDDRAFVLGDLMLKVDAIPHHVMTQEEFLVTAWVENKGEKVTDRDFLKQLIIEFSSVAVSDRHLLWLTAMVRTSKEPEIFSQHVAFSRADLGKQEIEMLLKGPTFERVNHQIISVYPGPVKVTTNTADPENHQLIIKPDSDVVQAKSLEMFATVIKPTGDIEKYTLPNQGDNSWLVKVNPKEYPGLYSVTLQVKGVTVDGRGFSIQTEPYLMGDAPVTKSKLPLVAKVVLPEIPAEKLMKQNAEKKAPAPPAPKTEAKAADVQKDSGADKSNEKEKHEEGAHDKEKDKEGKSKTENKEKDKDKDKEKDAKNKEDTKVHGADKPKTEEEKTKSGDTSEPQKEVKKSKLGLIINAVAIGLIILIVIAFWYRRRKLRQLQDAITDEENDEGSGKDAKPDTARTEKAIANKDKKEEAKPK